MITVSEKTSNEPFNSVYATRAIAFGAESLQVAFTLPFFVAFVFKVYIEGVPFDDAHMGELLSSSVMLARHTTVYVFMRQPWVEKKPKPVEDTEAKEPEVVAKGKGKPKSEPVVVVKVQSKCSVACSR